MKLTVFLKVSYQERHPCIPVLDLSEDTEMCVEPKCIDEPPWQHKTSNSNQTTASSFAILCTTVLILPPKCELIKMKTIIYAGFS